MKKRFDMGYMIDDDFYSEDSYPDTVFVDISAELVGRIKFLQQIVVEIDVTKITSVKDSAMDWSQLTIATGIPVTNTAMEVTENEVVFSGYLKGSGIQIYTDGISIDSL